MRVVCRVFSDAVLQFLLFLFLFSCHKWEPHKAVSFHSQILTQKWASVSCICPCVLGFLDSYMLLPSSRFSIEILVPLTDLGDTFSSLSSDDNRAEHLCQISLRVSRFPSQDKSSSCLERANDFYKRLISLFLYVFFCQFN